MARLTDLPLELRHEVYSYLLLPQNSKKPKKKSVKSEVGTFAVIYPAMATSLFTVNRTISKETLTYFYRENGFVAIRSNMDISLGWMRKLNACFNVTKKYQHGGCLRNVAAVATFKYHAQGRDYVHKDLFLCTFRQLPTMINILNADHLQNSALGITATCTIDFKLDRHWYVDNDALTSRLIDAFIKLTVAQPQPLAAPYLALHFDGKITASQLGLLRASPRPRCSLTALSGDPRWALEAGDVAHYQGSFALAEIYYSLVTWLLRAYGPFARSAEHRSELEDIHIETLVRQGRNHGCAGNDHGACRAAAGAIRASFCLKHAKYDNERMTYMCYKLGSMLLNTGIYYGNRKLTMALALLQRAEKGFRAMAEMEDKQRDVKVQIDKAFARLWPQKMRSMRHLHLYTVTAPFYDPQTDFPVDFGP